jgi:hypothetical protein
LPIESSSKGQEIPKFKFQTPFQELIAIQVQSGDPCSNSSILEEFQSNLSNFIQIQHLEVKKFSNLKSKLPFMS